MKSNRYLNPNNKTTDLSDLELVVKSIAETIGDMRVSFLKKPKRIFSKDYLERYRRSQALWLKVASQLTNECNISDKGNGKAG